MTLPEDLQDHLDQGDLGAVEDAWLARLEANSTDLDFFIETASRVAGDVGDPDTAQTLLDMLDEQLQSTGCHDLRLRLLRGAGTLMVADEDLHGEILRTLESLYASRPSFAALVEKVGLTRAPGDIPKTWQKVDKLETLLAYDIGTIVHMNGKGSGRVTEVNMALSSFVVTFERFGALRVGFAAAAKLLRPLPAGHILRRKHEEPEALARLRDEDPSALLRLVLESHDKPRTGAQVRLDLAGLVEERSWTSWWAAARKHPQVLAVGTGRRAYRWAATSADADDAVWLSFEGAEVKKRIALLRRHGTREPTLAARMCATLRADARRLKNSDPGLACAAWLSLEKHGVDREVALAALETAVRTTRDVRTLARGVHDRAMRERLYELIRDHREHWRDDLAALFEIESEARALDRLAEQLDAEGRLGEVIDTLLAQPRKAPAAFVWLVERAARHDAWRRRNPLRLLDQTLWSLADGPTFGTYRVRLQPAVESGGAVPRLIGDLTADQAPRALQAIARAGGIEGYQRDPLIAAIHLKFPEHREEDQAPLYATKEAITAKRSELKKLLDEEIPANRRAIEEARELGDLRENFEYKSARQRHEYLATRAAALDADLSRVRPINAAAVDGTKVVIGSRVSLRAADASERSITILGPWDSDPENDVLSNEAALARALLGTRVGQSVDIASVSMRVERIDPWL